MIQNCNNLSDLTHAAYQQVMRSSENLSVGSSYLRPMLEERIAAKIKQGHSQSNLLCEAHHGSSYKHKMFIPVK